MQCSNSLLHADRSVAIATITPADVIAIAMMYKIKVYCMSLQRAYLFAFDQHQHKGLLLS